MMKSRELRATGRKAALGIAAVLLAAALLPGQGRAADQERRSYILATATTGGTYYPVGVALSTLTKIKLEPETGISLSAISSAGSAENVKLLREDEAQFAILQGLYGAWAWNGTGPIEVIGPQGHLRAVTMLWENVEHFVLEAELAQTGTIEDLRGLEGEKFSIGKRNSGAEGSNRHILSALQIDIGQTLNPVFQGYGPSAEALQNGTIVGMSTPAGPPVAAVTRAFAALGGELVLLGFDEQALARINQPYALWHPRTIPANTYPGQSQDVQSIAHGNILAVRADVDEDAVYQITKVIYENLPYLKTIHKATAEMTLDKAIADLPVPLHPGAARYYKEQGLALPVAVLTPDK